MSTLFRYDSPDDHFIKFIAIQLVPVQFTTVIGYRSIGCRLIVSQRRHYLRPASRHESQPLHIYQIASIYLRVYFLTIVTVPLRLTRDCLCEEKQNRHHVISCASHVTPIRRARMLVHLLRDRTRSGCSRCQQKGNK